MPHRLIEQYLRDNRAFTRRYQSSRARRKRRVFRERLHGVNMRFTACSDGRVNPARAVQAPPGTATVLTRNIGGHYEVGWERFDRTLEEWARYVRTRLHAIPLLGICYHFSASSRKLGCAGWKNNTALALAHMCKLRGKIIDVYDNWIIPVVIGEETDGGPLVFHGENPDEVVDVGSIKIGLRNPRLKTFLREQFEAILSVPPAVISALVELAIGNLRYIRSLKRRGCLPHERDHQETSLCVGQCFPWVTEQPNTALVLGPCDPNLRQKLMKAVKIILHNSRKKGNRKRVEVGALVVCLPYRENWRRKAVIEEVLELARTVLEWIAADMPKMSKFFVPLVGVIDEDTYHFEPIEFAA